MVVLCQVVTFKPVSIVALQEAEGVRQRFYWNTRTNISMMHISATLRIQ